MTTFEFSTYRRPQFQGRIPKLSSARAAESEEDQMPTENLSDFA
jgi:hypothetical protein